MFDPQKYRQYNNQNPSFNVLQNGVSDQALAVISHISHQVEGLILCIVDSSLVYKVFYMKGSVQNGKYLHEREYRSLQMISKWILSSSIIPYFTSAMEEKFCNPNTCNGLLCWLLFTISWDMMTMFMRTSAQNGQYLATTFYTSSKMVTKKMTHSWLSFLAAVFIHSSHQSSNKERPKISKTKSRGNPLVEVIAPFRTPLHFPGKDCCQHGTSRKC